MLVEYLWCTNSYMAYIIVVHWYSKEIEWLSYVNQNVSFIKKIMLKIYFNKLLLGLVCSGAIFEKEYIYIYIYIYIFTLFL